MWFIWLSHVDVIKADQTVTSDQGHLCRNIIINYYYFGLSIKSFFISKENVKWGNEADSHTAKSLSCCFEPGSVRGKNMYFLIPVRDCVQQLHSTTSSTNWPILMSAKCHFIIKAWPSPSNWLMWLFLHSMALYIQYIRHTVNYIHNIHRWGGFKYIL